VRLGPNLAPSSQAIHAEANALLYTDRADLVGATLYVTCPPCDGCTKLIRGAKVTRVVVKPATEKGASQSLVEQYFTPELLSPSP
jgi:deoxycytidylate deaminase